MAFSSIMKQMIQVLLIAVYLSEIGVRGEIESFKLEEGEVTAAFRI